MDGNGRWASSRKLPRLAGHSAGTNNIRRIIRLLSDYGIRYLTLYAFSTENWSRPLEEVTGLFQILDKVISRELSNLHANNIRLLQIGRRDRISPAIMIQMERAIELTKNNSGMTMAVALDYGGRDEIIEALRAIIRDGVRPEALNEALLSKYLYTAHMPDPDLIIRTGGEERLSNFLLWQSAYAEFYSTQVYWPDFDEAHVVEALDAYSKRKRCFGGNRSME
jgi:undecaprenyl diphosphate synthase